MSRGSSSGTFARAAWMIVAVMSSGRRSLREPLKARPMGERAVETITASGMTAPLATGVGLTGKLPVRMGLVTGIAV
ncbi:hypothetical protein SALBM311S_08308 [Streptomyces alboniger]